MQFSHNRNQPVVGPMMSAGPQNGWRTLACESPCINGSGKAHQWWTACAYNVALELASQANADVSNKIIEALLMSMSFLNLLFLTYSLQKPAIRTAPDRRYLSKLFVISVRFSQSWFKLSGEQDLTFEAPPWMRPWPTTERSTLMHCLRKFKMDELELFDMLTRSAVMLNQIRLHNS